MRVLIFIFMIFNIFLASGDRPRDESEIRVLSASDSGELQESQLKSLGEFKLTAYCPCEECSGGWGDLTATGVTAKPGRTIAVDPELFTYGTELSINGISYVTEDCGGGVKGKHIDIFFNTHSETVDFGVQKMEVFVIDGD